MRYIYTAIRGDELHMNGQFEAAAKLDDLETLKEEFVAFQVEARYLTLKPGRRLSYFGQNALTIQWILWKADTKYSDAVHHYPQGGYLADGRIITVGAVDLEQAGERSTVRAEITKLEAELSAARERLELLR